MASSFVFYKFKSQREPSRIAFDGTAISVWDLKKEIIAENRMGKGADFDFAIYNADTEEEYTNDYTMIPRSTSVLARRLPPSKPGHGSAQKYMVGTDESGSGGGLQAGRGAAPDPRGGVGAGQKGGYSKEMFTKRFDGRDDGRPAGGAGPSQGNVQIPAAAPNDEASAMAAMFAQTNTQWQQTQEQMSQATPVHRNPPPGGFNRPQHSGGGGGGAGGPGGNRPSFRDSPNAHKPPPPGYICYRCGQKGHWIQDCPTNGDAAYDNRPRIKRTTGIPKSFLTEVAGPVAPSGDDVEKADGVKSGIMVTADGGFVVARPDNASWFAHRARTANLSANDIQNLAPTDPDLTCPVCSKLLRDAVLTPCCSTSFCDECVSNALLDNDMLCPECETRVKNLDKLVPDEGRRERCQVYVDEMVQASKEAAEQEKEQREADEARRKAEEEKRKAAALEAAGVEDEKKDVKEEEEEKKPEPEQKKENDDEELFPAKPQEILNPRKRRVGESPPPSEEMAKSASNASATPAPPTPTGVAALPPTPAVGTGFPNMPIGMTAAAQAQFLRQQQQARMMGGNGAGGVGAPGLMGMGMGGGMMGNGMGGMGLPSPQMLQQQLFQLNGMLANPALPPPMRFALSSQVQQCQMMLMQMQQRAAAMAAATGGVGGGMNGFGGVGNGHGAGMAGVPKGPAAMQQAAAGQKRAREGPAEGEPAAKKAEQ
ncbi:hypothetical protein JCM10207_004559 [Rhodosporidiobolus poonsookiae]